MFARKQIPVIIILLIVLTFISTSTFLISFIFIERSVILNSKTQLSSSTISSNLEVLSTKKYVTKSISERGLVPELSTYVLFFNRIPKTGGEMIVLLLQWLQGINSFRHVRLKGGNVRRLSNIQQEELVSEVTSIIRKEAVPVTFDRHVYFVNFSTFDRQSPIYFNVVRDPIDKVYSRFYYARASLRSEKLRRSVAPPKKHLSKTFDECFKNGNEECKFISGKPYDLSIPYFCGHDYRCMLLNNEWALSHAKLNVERYFPVVGVLEELNSTLELLEHKLPFFFKGVQKMYYKELLEPHKNRNKFRPKKKDASIYEYLKSHLQTEYEFYYWIRSRLFKQLTLLYGH